MKKETSAILFTALLFICLFSYAKSAKADVWLQTTLTVSSVTIPQRAVMLGLPATTQFEIWRDDGSSTAIEYQIVDNANGKVVNSITMGHGIAKGMPSSTLVFDAVTGDTYTPRIMALPWGVNQEPLTDCAVPPSFGYLMHLYWCNGTCGLGTGPWSDAYCPNPPYNYGNSSYFYVSADGTPLYFNLPVISGS